MSIVGHWFRYSQLYSVHGFCTKTLLEPYSESKSPTRWGLVVPHNLKSFCRSWQQFCSKKTENVVLKIGWSRPKKKSYAETWAAGGQYCCRQELLYTDIFLFPKQTLPRISHKPFQRSNSMQQRKFFSQGLVGAKAHTQGIFMPHEQFKDWCNPFFYLFIHILQSTRFYKWSSAGKPLISE